MFYMTYYAYVIKVFVISVITVSHSITHNTEVDMFTYIFYLDTFLFTKPADYTRVPHANPNIDDNGIHHRNSWEKEAFEFGLN